MLIEIALQESATHRSILKQIEAACLHAWLLHCKGNMTRVAKLTGIGRPYLYKKVKEYGIDPELYRDEQTIAPIPPGLTAVSPIQATRLTDHPSHPEVYVLQRIASASTEE